MPNGGGHDNAEQAAANAERNIYSRYGLKDNPYRPSKRARVLNPLERPDDEGRFIQVSHLGRLNEIELLLEAQQQQPSFFLIIGGTGSGRTSAANYLLDRWRHHNQLNKNRIVVPERHFENQGESSYAIFKAWLGGLRNELDDLKLKLADELEVSIKDAEKVERDMMPTKYKGIIKRISKALATSIPPAGFGVCLENVKSFNVIADAFRIFSQANTICVFTVLDNDTENTAVIKPFQISPEGGKDRILA